MKLLINTDLHWSAKFDTRLSAEELAADQSYFRYLAEVAAKFSLWGKYEVTDDLVDFRIVAQKVTVDEVAMNKFFDEFLTELFRVEIRYVGLGGAGCDFAIELTKAEPFGQNPTTTPEAAAINS